MLGLIAHFENRLFYWVQHLILQFCNHSSHHAICHSELDLNWKHSSKREPEWRHNESNGVSNHQPRNCLLNRLFRRRLKKTSKLRVTGLCVGNSPVTGEFPKQMASNAENVSIWWRHDDKVLNKRYMIRCATTVIHNCNSKQSII